MPTKENSSRHYCCLPNIPLLPDIWCDCASPNPDDGCDQKRISSGQRNVSTSCIGNLKSCEQFMTSIFPLKPQWPTMFPTMSISSEWILDKGWCEEKRFPTNPEEHVAWTRINLVVLSHRGLGIINPTLTGTTTVPHTFWHGIPTRRWSCAMFD